MFFGSHVFGSRMYGGGSTIAEMFSTDRVVFEGLSLSDGSEIVLTGLEDSGPTREVVGDSVPRGDGMFITADYFRERKITAQGYVKAATKAAMATKLDLIRKTLRTR